MKTELPLREYLDVQGIVQDRDQNEKKKTRDTKRSVKCCGGSPPSPFCLSFYLSWFFFLIAYPKTTLLPLDSFFPSVGSKDSPVDFFFVNLDDTQELNLADRIQKLRIRMQDWG